MKGMKKLLSILMVLTLVLSLGASAFAATVTISPNPKDTNPHTYKAYQIFKGEQAASVPDDMPLGEIEWGQGIDNPAAFLADLQANDAFVVEGVNKFAACETAKDVAKALGELGKDYADAFAEVVYDHLGTAEEPVITAGGSVELDDGYYLIVDETEFAADAENAVKNGLMLQMTGKIEITPKYDVPSSEKKVIDINDTTENIPYTIKPGPTNEAWEDSADHDLGDDVWFKLSGTLPTDLESYRELGYTLTFHDKEDAGLNFNSDSVSVYYVSPDGKTQQELTSGFEIKVNPGDEDTFDVIFPNVFEVDYDVAPGGKIVVVYSSTLEGDNVKYGTEGNWNEMYMEYSNDSRNEGTGKTPKDKVVVFTYKMETLKVDGDLKDLDGAGFTLLKKFLKPDDNATHEDAPEYNYKNVQDAEKGDWLIEKDSEGKIVAYWKVVGKINDVDAKANFSFPGIDDGTYRLVETEVPAGFNKADDMEFVISGTHTNDPDDLELTLLKADGKTVDANELIEVGCNTSTGTVSNQVVNEEGPVLPETGGIGTTIFYIAGAILVAGAVILLVTKKRVSGMEK